jgi:hypothetical protein
MLGLTHDATHRNMYRRERSARAQNVWTARSGVAMSHRIVSRVWTACPERQPYWGRSLSNGLWRVISERGPYCVSQAFRVLAEASLARAQVALGIDAFPPPDAHGVVKEAPIETQVPQRSGG